MLSRFTLTFLYLLIVWVYVSIFGSSLWGQDKPKGPPPANVSVAEATSGLVSPQAEFIGTVFYQEVSDVASEINGRAEVVEFEEGQRVKKGQVLVKLGSDILRKNLQATISTYEQVLSELEIAKIELKRKEKLLKNKSIAEQTYDQDRFRVIGLEKHAASLKAQVERIEIELKKKIIRAPYHAIVIKRLVDRGEWISEGEEVAVLAKDDVVDIVVEVPERFIPFVKKGMQVNGTVNSNAIKGNVFTIIPRGDIITRTIPIKIRLPNSLSLIEGMSAKVTLPTGNSKKALIVPRDAIISMFGQTVVFSVNESKAGMRPVKIIGYEGLNAGIEANGLEEGMLVVVDGNERLKDGQAVAFKKSENRGQ
jgi:membrane fusion protein (multidrug efflux system)